MSGIKTQIVDSRVMEVPIPASNIQSEELGKFIAHSAQDGYVLTAAVAVQGGSQRDPYTVGLRVKLTRKNADAESDLRLP